MRLKIQVKDFEGKKVQIQKEIRSLDHLQAQIKYKKIVFKDKKKQIPRKAKYKNLPYDMAPMIQPLRGGAISSGGGH